MKICLFCNKIVPTNRVKYCSSICVKRAWYCRSIPDTRKSFWKKSRGFNKTETGKGLRWEKYAAKLLGAKHCLFAGSEADLIWNGLRVDVKSSNLYKRKTKRGKVVGTSKGWWVFNRNKEKPIDFFLCIALIDDSVFKILLIPNSRFPKKGAVVGWKGKYDEFIYTP